MIFDIMTLFPDMFSNILSKSIIGRAVEKEILIINTFNIRDYSTNKHKKVDDYPYGGGGGMIMSTQPIIDTYNHIIGKLNYKPRTIYLSPQGKILSQGMIERLKMEQHIILLCGHYEGIDERIIENIVDEEISIGDYVLTGGELPAMVLIDVVSRQLKGVLTKEEAYKNESIYNGLVEYPQYTRPEIFDDKKVPEILLSGHHANIKKWRFEKSVERTKEKRPDLYKSFQLKNK